MFTDRSVYFRVTFFLDQGVTPLSQTIGLWADTDGAAAPNIFNVEKPIFGHRIARHASLLAYQDMTLKSLLGVVFKPKPRFVLR